LTKREKGFFKRKWDEMGMGQEGSFIERMERKCSIIVE